MHTAETHAEAAQPAMQGQQHFVLAASSSQQAQLQPAAARPPPCSCCDTQTDQDCSSSGTCQQLQVPAQSRPSTAAVQCVLDTATAAEDGVAERLAAIREKNSRHDHTAGLDIVHEEGEEEGPAADDARHIALQWDSGSGSKADAAAGVPPVDAAGGAGLAAMGQQAAAMVLNLEDLTQCTPEVLEIELKSLDVEQLVMLKQML